MVEWEPLIELKGGKKKRKQFDQRKRFREYAQIQGGSLHCNRKHGTVIMLAYFLAGIVLLMVVMKSSHEKENLTHDYQSEFTSISESTTELPETTEMTTTTSMRRKILPKKKKNLPKKPQTTTTTMFKNSTTTRAATTTDEAETTALAETTVSVDNEVAQGDDEWLSNTCDGGLPKYRGLDLCEKMPNQNLIFHNKLPKSGSTTFFQLLVALGRKNNFDLIHLHPCFDPDDPMGFVDFETGLSFPEDFEKDPKFCKHSLQRNEDLAKWLKENLRKGKKTIVMKHHVYMDFTPFHIKQPTFINVARDPVSLFASKFYFERYSCNTCVEERTHQPDDDKMRETLEDCIKSQDEECYGGNVKQIFIEYLCGASAEGCKRGKNEADVKKLVEKIKHNVLREYYVVGILEEMDLTMKLFELMMPNYFAGLLDTYHGPVGTMWTNNSATAFHYNVSAESRQYLAKGPLRHSMDIYNFIKAIFLQRIKAFGLE